jgi:hypothetical protein
MLYLSKPYDKGYSLQFEGTEQDTKAIRQLMVSELHGDGYLSAPRGFLQSDCRTYLMVEFWTDNQDLILESCLAFATRYSYELEIL